MMCSVTCSVTCSARCSASCSASCSATCSVERTVAWWVGYSAARTAPTRLRQPPRRSTTLPQFVSRRLALGNLPATRYDSSFQSLKAFGAENPVAEMHHPASNRPLAPMNATYVHTPHTCSYTCSYRQGCHPERQSRDLLFHCYLLAGPRQRSVPQDKAFLQTYSSARPIMPN